MRPAADQRAAVGRLDVVDHRLDGEPAGGGPLTLGGPGPGLVVQQPVGERVTERDPVARGDQLVTLQVEIPEGDADLAKRLEGWRDTRDLRAKFGS